MIGRIKSLKRDKYFGFIAAEAGGRDVFFHHSELVNVRFDELHEGDSVSFDMSDTEKGPKATHVARPQ